LTYFLIGKDLNNQFAFSFLLDLKNSFLKSFSHEKIYDSKANQLNSFNSKIKKLIKKYSDNKLKSKNFKINSIDETKILNENANLIIQNKQKVNTLSEKTETLINKSHQLYEDVKQI